MNWTYEMVPEDFNWCKIISASNFRCAIWLFGLIHRMNCDLWNMKLIRIYERILIEMKWITVCFKTSIILSNSAFIPRQTDFTLFRDGSLIWEPVNDMRATSVNLRISFGAVLLFLLMKSTCRTQNETFLWKRVAWVISKYRTYSWINNIACEVTYNKTEINCDFSFFSRFF